MSIYLLHFRRIFSLFALSNGVQSVFSGISVERELLRYPHNNRLAKAAHRVRFTDLNHNCFLIKFLLFLILEVNKVKEFLVSLQMPSNCCALISQLKPQVRLGPQKFVGSRTGADLFFNRHC